MTGVEQSLTTAYSSEENGIVERANQEVLRHLNAILFDSRVHDRWSFGQLPMVQRIMNTLEKTSTGVTPAQLILNNSVQLSQQILQSDRVSYPPDTTTPSQQIALSDRMDDWISKQSVLLQVARVRQTKSDFHALVEYDPAITEYPVNSYVLFTPPVGRSFKLLPRHRGRHSPSTLLKTLLMANGQLPIYIICDLPTMTQRGQYLWKSPTIMNRNLW